MIRFHYETDFLLKKEKNVIDWISKVISLEERKVGEINYIFCDDKYLLKKNIKYLNHDTLTDIITFDYCDENIVSSDIMISIERVKSNSKIFKTTFSNELNRVIIHGILHLVGYGDKTKKEEKEIRKKEDYYLTLIG